MTAGWRSEARQRLDAMTHPDLPDPISVDLRRALDALDAVLALHRMVDMGGGQWICDECQYVYPTTDRYERCPTVRAIEGDART